jgi:peptidase inhibitor family I36
MPRLVRFAVPCVAFLLVACGSFDTLGPTPLDEGVILYIHADFVGSSQQVNSDVADFGDVEGPCVVSSDDGSTATWDDCISSIRVLPGWRARLYRDPDFRGASIEVTEDLHDLTAVSGPCHGTFNDCASSIRVSRR